MSHSNRHPGTSIIERIKQIPQAFSFTQIMRILEGMAPRRGSTPARRIVQEGSDFRPPKAEPVRLRGRHNLTYPGQEVTALSKDDNQWQLHLGFMGVAGAMGPLPFHYTELLLERQKQKDQALAAFLDIFAHRSATLFWRASTKYRLPLEFERARRDGSSGRQVDKHTELLLSLLGLSPRIFKNKGLIEPESLIYYGGLLSQKVCTSANLQQILTDYFSVPIQVEEFSGAWSEVLPGMLCRLPSLSQPRGQNNCLGRTTLSGKRAWLAQNKVKIIVGPLRQAQYQQFAPGSHRLAALRELTSLYLGMENSCDFSIQIKHEELPNRLPLTGDRRASLGWNTRLPQARPERNTGRLLTIPLSNH